MYCSFTNHHTTHYHEHAKNKWQPKRVMWITATRRRPMTRFLHACGSVRGAQACGRVGGRVSGCASVRVCVWGGGEGGGAQHLSSCFLRYCVVALACELKSLGNAIGNGNGQGVAAGVGVGAGLGWGGAGLGWGGAGLVLGWCWVGVELGGVGPGLGLVEDVGLGLGRGLGETS